MRFQVLIVIFFINSFSAFDLLFGVLVWLRVGVYLVLFGLMMGRLFLNFLALSQMIRSATSSTIQIRFNRCFAFA